MTDILSWECDIHTINSTNQGKDSGNSSKNSEQTNHRIGFDVHQ